ncbi:MAG TPA: glycosyltransferase family 4 protein [Solirubrobacterales bacterium]|nr:glycosyltransferase family 4 protein [Solirubrobacterales bacterium]
MSAISERPRVLHVGPDPVDGGGMAASRRGLFASPLAERYRMEFLATYRSPSPLARSITFLGALLKLAAWSVRGRGRLVHVHATVRGSAYRKSLCVLLAKLLRRRVVLQVHSGAGDIAVFRGSRGRLSLGLFRAAFASADAVVSVSGASAEALKEAGVEARIEVVPNAAPPVARTERVRDDGPGGTVRFAYLGGFANSAKGGDVLLAALEGAIARSPELRIELAGPGELPEAGAELIERGLPVTWLGWLDEDAKAALLDRSQALVLSSRSEGLPMALLEGMARGMAIVSTRVGGIPEVVGDREGILVPPEDPEALADALCALAADPELRDRLGEAARVRVERLDEVEVAGRLEELYERLLG